MPNCIKDISHKTAFDKLNAFEQKKIIETKRSIHLKKNDIVLKQGDTANTIFYSISGLFKLHIEGHNKDIILTLKQSDSFLGLTSLYYKKGTYQYTITALEDSVVEAYNQNDFREILKTNVAFSNEIIRFINHNSARIFKKHLCVIDKNSRGKIAEMLLCTANNIYDSLKFTLPMSRKEMGDFVGLSMENTVRVLNELKSENLIMFKGKCFAILDKEGLEKVSDLG